MTYNWAYMIMKLAIQNAWKLVTFVIAVALVWTSLGGTAQAAIVTREDAGLDENLADQENDTYAPIQKVLLARVPIPAGVRFGDSEEMYHGLFYYSIAHLGFIDIPFNYVVTWEGVVYEGKAGGTDVQPLISENTDDQFKNSVIIAYYDNNQEMTYVGKDALVDLVSQIQSYAGLSDDSVIPVDISIAKKTQELEISMLQVASGTDALWGSIVAEIKRSSSSDPSTGAAEVKGEVGEIVYNREVKADENFVVTAHIKNTGTVPWYNSGAHQVYLSTSDPRNHDSAFFVSDRWSSFTRVVVAEEEWVLPGESGTFSFEIGTPLRPGSYSEKFELLMLSDRWIEGTQFDVSFTVTAGDFELVEILETETGYLNVRDCPSSGCNEISKVVPGDVLVKKGIENNWYKIQLDDGREGWVSGKYVKVL